MQSSLKKSLYLGLAALSFGAVAATTTNASAKSYATAGTYTKLSADYTKRNVQATGTNALYTKPGTVKGAKVVASKATMAELAASKKSANYFRAYGVKTTNRGSVYYRVVTMDQKYRGYIYGGKADTAFAGGIKAVETTTAATMPTRTTGYYLKDTSKNTLWTAPKYTQYKSGATKVNLYGAAKTDPFKVDKAATKTAEGSLYYHVVDEKDASISGWIYAGKGYNATITDNTKQDLGGLSLNVASDAATNDNSVKVVYRDAKNANAQVGTQTWINAPKTGDAATKAGEAVSANAVNTANVKLADFITNNVPANYTTTDTVATTGTYGNTVYVDVVAAATSKVQLRVDSVDNTLPTDAQKAAQATAATNLETAKKALADLPADATEADKTAANKAVTDAEAAVEAAKVADVAIVNPLTVGTKLSSADLTATLKGDAIKALSGSKGSAISPAALTTIQTGLGTTDAIKGTKAYYTSNGTAYHYDFTFEPDDFNSDNRTANYGDTLTASYKAQLVLGAPKTDSSDSSWIA